MLIVLSNFFKSIIDYISRIFKNTRGVRILKCKVDEKGRKIVVFQVLGSFHSEEMEYNDYKNGLIYDTEPSDVELVAIFFHCNNFEKYKIYSFDPINGIISICDSLHKNIINITSENWPESIKYIKNMNNSEAQHVVHSIVNFELNNYIFNQNEAIDSTEIDSEYLDLESLKYSNVIKMNFKDI
jgi:hypothetical protein